MKHTAVFLLKLVSCLVWPCLASALNAQSATSPNIVWIVCEDISPTLSMYGDSIAHTPNLDALASESIIYDAAFAPVGVCAPSRSGIITGYAPTRIGSMHMRTGKDIQGLGRKTYQDRIPVTDLEGDPIREYAVVLPEGVRCFPEYLREAGYYCINNAKTDYQFAAPVTAWNENGNQAHWRNREEGQPFFAVFNTALTHESKLWKHADQALTVDPSAVAVPPYLPDTEMMRTTVARHYSNVELMDAFVGRIIAELKADQLYNETIIFFYSDHGGPLPRQKREIYDSGLRVPLLVRLPGATQTERIESPVSLIDLGPTVLSLAGIEPDQMMEGRAFLGPHKAPARRYVYGSSDRFDEYTDRSRMVRDGRFLYVRHFLPDLTKYKDVAYRKNIPAMKEMLALAGQKSLSPAVADWFEPKPEEELYDCWLDPHNLHNLADRADYQDTLRRFREVLLERLISQPDLGFMPEATLIDLMWPAGEQPQVAAPMIAATGNTLALSSRTAGASLAYQWSDMDTAPSLESKYWKLYHTPLERQAGKYLFVVAERPGYATSSVRCFYCAENE